MGGRRIVAAKWPRLGLLVVVMQPLEWPRYSHSRGRENPALRVGSGSRLRVMSHDVKSVISGVFIVGYIVGVSLLICPTTVPLCEPSLMV